MPVYAPQTFQDMYVRAMNQLYRVRAIVMNDEDHMRDAMANDYTAKHEKTAVIAQWHNMVVIADIEPFKFIGEL